MNKFMKKRSVALMALWLLSAMGVIGMCAAAIPSTPEEIVRQDLQALSRNDVEAAVALFSEDAKMYKTPSDPRKLVGDLIPEMSGREAMRKTMQASKGPPDRYEIIDMTSIGELVIARQKITSAPDYAKSHYSLVAYRVKDGLIRDLWHIARSDDASVLHNEPALAVIRKVVAAQGSSDADAMVALFSDDAKNYVLSEVPFRLSDEPSHKAADRESRLRGWRTSFEKEPKTVRNESLASLVFGDLVVSRERAALRDDTTQDVLSIFRIRDGLIQDDWFVAIVDR